MSAEQALAPLTGRLRAWGLESLAAAALEQAGPLAFLGAQLLYVAAPVGGWLALDSQLTLLAGVLEDPQARRAWARQLAQEADGQA